MAGAPHALSGVTVLTPAERSARALPRKALWVWLGCELVAFPNPASRGGFFDAVDGLLKLGAIVSAIVLAHWLEERVFVRFVGRSRLARVAVALLLPVGFLLAAGVGTAAFGILGLLGDDGTGVASVALAALWATSAAFGSLVVVLIDVVVSAVVQGFRGRIQLAVLSLVLLSAAAVGALALALGNVERSLGYLARHVNLRVDMGAEGRLAGEGLARALARPEVAQLVAGTLAVVFSLAALPAVLSACGKLADAVMERLHPMSRAFSALGQGDLNVRLEEGGSRDFRDLARAFNGMVGDLSLSRNMERAFGQYVSPQVLGRIRHQHGEAALPAELREASVFFADVRGFTSMSERLAPADVLSVLNRYFERVIQVIDEHEGYLDKFIGDAVVVVFNGPIDQPDHAERAARCAIAIQRAVAELNRDGAFPEVGTLEVGIGVTTGPLVAGNLGSHQHMEYTVIGDTVNLAARLTSRAPAGEVWANARNAERLPDDLTRAELAPFSVKGKTEPVRAYRLWPPPGQILAPPVSGDEPGASMPPI